MKYSDGWKYKTEAVEVAEVPEFSPNLEAMDGQAMVHLLHMRLTIANQYPWNGASFILFQWFGTPDTWKTPSLIHDALYQLMRESQLPASERKTIDGIFYRLLMARCPGFDLCGGCQQWWGVLVRPFWMVQCLIAYYCVRIGGNYAMRHGAKVKEVA